MSYNKTQLSPDQTFERHIFHRDQFAHYLRWTYVLKLAEIGMNILDVGCGSGNLFQVFYRNRFKPSRYLGLDIRKQTIDKNIETWGDHGAAFEALDLCLPGSLSKFGNRWDIICSFEVFEHVTKKNGPILLKNIKECMSEKTVCLISTPCFDPKVGAADNHIIDGEIGEYGYEEFKGMLESELKIVHQFGTFCSKKDIKQFIPAELKPFYDSLNEYYDSNLMSNLFAPLFPEHSRNVIWNCSL